MFVSVRKISQTYERISTKIFKRLGCSPRTNRLDFSSDPDHDPDPGLVDPEQNPDAKTFIKFFNEIFRVLSVAQRTID